MKLRQKAVATLVISALSLGVLGGAISITDRSQAVEGTTPPLDFSACVQANGSGSVLLLMDESGTVYGRLNASGADAEPSDPNNQRLAASKIMLEKLQRVSDVYKAPVNVMLAGFGDNFVPRTPGWVQIEPGGSASLQSNFYPIIDNWEQRPADGNNRETDTFSSIGGAQAAFADQGKCRLLVLFKDGIDYQRFTEAASGEVSDPEIQRLIENGDKVGAESLAREEICRPGGVADGLRTNEVFLLSVALGSDKDGSDFSDLRGLTEGSSECGNLPGYGKVLATSDPNALPSLFSNALDPRFEPSVRTDNFSFNMTNALSSINILTTGLGAFTNYTVSAPCPGGQLEFEALTPQETRDFGPGVSSKSQWFSDQTFKITIDHTNQDDECWVGEWNVKPNSAGALSEIEFDANIEAFSSLVDGQGFLIPGGDPKEYQIALRRTSDKSPINPADLDSSITGLVGASFLTQTGGIIEDHYSGSTRLPLSNLDGAHSVSAPSDLPPGDYNLTVELEVRIEGLGVKLRPVRTAQRIQVRNPIQAPQAIQVVDFGDIQGNNPALKQIEIQQSPDADFTLEWNDEATRVEVSQHPKGLSYITPTVDSKSTIEIPRGDGVVTVTIALRPYAEGEIQTQGPVAGKIFIAAVPDGSQSNKDQLVISFTASQKADANLGIQVFFVIFLTLLGLGITLGALQFVAWLIARFPTALDVANRDIRALSISGEIVGDSFVPSGSSGFAELQNHRAWQDISVESNRKTAHITNHSFQAKSGGWRLGSAGYGQMVGSGLVGWGSGLESGDAGTSSMAPQISLHLQRSWLVAIDQSALPASIDEWNSGKSIPATAILVIGTPAGQELTGDFGAFGSTGDNGDKDRMISELQSTIPHRVPNLIKKVSGSRGGSSKASGKSKAVKNAEAQNEFSFTKDPNDPFA